MADDNARLAMKRFPAESDSFTISRNTVIHECGETVLLVPDWFTEKQITRLKAIIADGCIQDSEGRPVDVRLKFVPVRRDNCPDNGLFKVWGI